MDLSILNGRHQSNLQGKFNTQEIDNWFRSGRALGFFQKVYSIFFRKNPIKTSKHFSFLDAIQEVSKSHQGVPEMVKNLDLKNINKFFQQTIGATNKWDFLEKLGVINMETRRKFDPSAIDYSEYVAVILANFSLKTGKEINALIK